MARYGKLLSWLSAWNDQIENASTWKISVEHIVCRSSSIAATIFQSMNTNLERLCNLSRLLIIWS